MSDDRYRQIFEDLGRDLLAVAKKHGMRATKHFLREAVRDAAKGNLIQEDDQQGDDGDTPPEELDYPDEDVWTLPPPPDEREEDEDELSDAGKRVLSQLMDRLKKGEEK